MRPSHLLAPMVAVSMFLSVFSLVPFTGSAQPSAVLLPPCVEYVQDTDSDGLIDYLVFDVTLEVYVSGNYYLSLRLYDSLGGYICSVATEESLPSGVQVQTLSVEGSRLSAHSVDGPYEAEISLWDNEYYVIDSLTHTTSAYSCGEFELAPASLYPPHADYGLDTDGDSLYNYLAVDVFLEVREAGNYTVTVSLDHWMWCQNISYLDEGIQAVQLLFDGLTLRAFGYAKTYEVFIDLGKVSWDIYERGTHTTAFYSWDEFQRKAAKFGDPHSSHTVDTDGDGLYDFLVVEALVDVHTPGAYVVEGGIMKSWYDTVCYTESKVMLDAGLHAVQLFFPGWKLRLEMDYEYEFLRVNLYLRTDRGQYLDSSSHMTAMQSSSQFETPPAHFSPPHDDYSLSSYDGLFLDRLVVDVAIEVEVAGDFIIAAVLYEPVSDTTIDFDIVDTALAVGSDSVSLSFSGRSISSSGVDGPYSVAMMLTDSWYNIMDTGNHVTRQYLASAFGGPMPLLESSWSGTAPDIDGCVSPGEWEGAEALSLKSEDRSNRLETVIHVMNDLERLYVCLDVMGDDTKEWRDLGAILFDTGHDGLPSDGHEDLLVLSGEAEGYHMVYDAGNDSWTEHCCLFGCEGPCAEGLSGAAGFGPTSNNQTSHRIYEFSVPLDLLGVGAGDVVGFSALVAESRAVYGERYWESSAWPIYLANLYWFPALEICGDLKLAFPVKTSASLSGTDGLKGWFRSDVTVTLTSFAAYGLDRTMSRVDGGLWLPYSGPFVVSGEGVHTVEYYSVDSEQNQETPVPLAVRIDTLAPTSACSVSGTAGNDGWLRGEASVTLFADDGPQGSGVSMLLYRVGSGEWLTYYGPIAIQADGEHIIEYGAFDEAGNGEAVEAVVVKVDTTPPATVCSADGFTVTLSATDNTSGVFRTVFRISAGEWADYTGPIEVPSSGRHTVEYYSVDVAGNVEETKTLVVEKGPGGGTLSLGGWGLWIALALIAAAVVIVIFKLMAKGKGAGKAGGEQSPEHRDSTESSPGDLGPPKN